MAPSLVASVQRCPVCYGKGWVPQGFYTGMTSAIHTNNDECRTCEGGGILWIASGQPARATNKGVK